MTASKKTQPTWSAVKTKLADFDRAALIGLVQDLYSASKDNQIFLHARFDLGEDVLLPYKRTLGRWLWPDVSRNQNFSVAKAKKAIADYKKAVGKTEGLAELMVFYCEQAVGFSDDIGLEDEGYFDALVRMFEQALKAIAALPDGMRPAFWERLNKLRFVSRKFGYGIADEMTAFFAEYRINTGLR